MMIKGITILVLFLTSCTMSFQPFPASISKVEANEKFEKLESNDKAIAQALNALAEEAKKKK